MATRAVPVSEATYRKNPEAYVKTETDVPGVGVQPAYFRVERLDDLLLEPRDDVRNVRFTIAREIPQESDDVVGPPAYSTRAFEVDLTEENEAAFLSAIEPFIKAGREVVPAPETAVRKRQGVDPRLTAWMRRAKAWARDQGHDVPSKGRLKEHLQEEYVRLHPQDPKPLTDVEGAQQTSGRKPPRGGQGER